MQGESQPSGFLHWVHVVTIGRKPKRTLLRVAILIILTVVTFKFVLLPIRVVGLSMEPTFHNRSINFINRLSYIRSEPRRGDVVGIRLAGEHLMFLKRVVGLPGEAVSFEDGHVCINGVRQEEPYLRLPTDWKVPEKVLGADEYYVVGDNRSMRPEEHTQGKAPRWRILGKVLFSGNP
jgi:signal peptidase I